MTKWIVKKDDVNVHESTGDELNYNFGENYSIRSVGYVVEVEDNNGCTAFTDVLKQMPCDPLFTLVDYTCQAIAPKNEDLLLTIRIDKVRTDDMEVFATLYSTNINYECRTEKSILPAGQNEITLTFKKFWPYSVLEESSDYFHAKFEIISTVYFIEGMAERSSCSILGDLPGGGLLMQYCGLKSCQVNLRIKSPTQNCEIQVYAENSLFFSLDDLSIGSVAGEVNTRLTGAVQEALGKNDTSSHINFYSGRGVAADGSYYYDFNGHPDNNPYGDSTFTLYAYTLDKNYCIISKKSETFQTPLGINYKFDMLVNWDTCTNALS